MPTDAVPFASVDDPIFLTEDQELPTAILNDPEQRERAVVTLDAEGHVQSISRHAWATKQDLYFYRRTFDEQWIYMLSIMREWQVPDHIQEQMADQAHEIKQRLFDPQTTEDDLPLLKTQHEQLSDWLETFRPVDPAFMGGENQD